MITFAELTRALDSTGILFTAYAWATPTGDAPAWGAVFVNGSRPIYGDDGHAEEILSVRICMCTRVLDDTAFTAVNDKLQQLGRQNDMTWRLGNPRYDNDNHLITYEWYCEGVLLTGFE